MKLSKLLGGCLLMQPYDSFIYSKIMTDSYDDVELTQWIIDTFKLTANVYNNLHVSKVNEERYKTFSEFLESYKIENESTTINSVSVNAMKISDDLTFCIVITFSEKTFIIY